ncbi:MAG: UDPGP type 1 family protein, partial [Ruminococcus sp.]
MRNLIAERLELLDQTHLLRYIKELSSQERNQLLKQIDNLDFSVLDDNIAENKRGSFEPPFAMSIEEIDKNREQYRKTGIQAIRDGKVGAVLLAGGQGSRLGFNKPKGMFNIGVNKELFIFQCLINNLLDVV